ncbi:50S ribosomal protein 6, chloroplastic [Impatiens glandulifera]|uniref:50S ribosomal protein 6, chloroplastic n=1 Tax=Impatiens glandulifera TaxID=253017 RepID=UPI001FB1A1B1|nr:50S ribosomal protein 6, chloroplastic [Impatiens glandulifera]
MSVSALLGVKMPVLPSSVFISSGFSGNTPSNTSPRLVTGVSTGLKIDCSSRPQKKATKHHMKTRPRKSQPWDINRKPTVYPPVTFPPDWTLVEDAVPVDLNVLVSSDSEPENVD